VAAKRPHSISIHGKTWQDDYFWLRERENPDVLAYIEAENAYTEAMMAHTADLQEALYQEMRGRIKETDLTVPYPKGDYLYYDRTEEGQQYPIFCRKAKTPDAAEEVLLDQNQLAEGLEFFEVGVLRVSPNHQLLAYSIDTNGSERFTLHIKNLQTGQNLAEEIPNTYYFVEWANDNETLFYTTLDEAVRSNKLHRHQLGDGQANDVVLWHEEDNRFYVTLRRTSSGDFVILHLRSNVTTETHFLDANRPYTDLQMLYARQQGIEYDVVHHGSNFYIRTNEEAQNFKLVAVPIARPDKAHWQTVLAHREDVTITAVHAFQNHLVVSTRENGLEQFLILNLADGTSHHIEFPDPTYALTWGDNEEFNTHVLRFKYTSLITPESVFDYDMNTRERELKKQQEVIGYDESLYTSERIWATAVDGTQIPISLAYRRGL
jgi:oligopeptidase B